MARRSFRDRFWSPPVARVVTAPSSFLLALAVAAIGIVAVAPVSLPLGIAAGLVAGALAYGIRVLVAVPGQVDPTAGIDPFAVQEPWRRFVQDALAARRRYTEAVRRMEGGPLRDRLDDIGSRLDDGIHETWRVARHGHLLAQARGQVDTAAAEADLAVAEARRAAAPDDPRAGQAADALAAQLASARRMQAVVEDAEATLRLLDARLDEAVARAVELSTARSAAQAVERASAVGGDVDGIVTEVEALRTALEEADAAGGTPATGSS